jgi:hypothetical protein
MRAQSFRDDFIGPFDQRYENVGAAELRAPGFEIGFRDPTGPGARASGEDRDVLRNNPLPHFIERRPPDWHDRRGGGFAHQIGRFAGEKDPNLMASV